MESNSAASSAGDHSNHTRRAMTNEERYAEYNVYGNLFQVSRKYVIPRIRPLGRGAYGIVWYVFLLRSLTHAPTEAHTYVVRTNLEDFSVTFLVVFLDYTQ